MGKNTIQACLNEEDAKLFEEAVKKYGMKKSSLLNEIIHSWLFSNKLNLIKEDKGKTKKGGKK